MESKKDYYDYDKICSVLMRKFDRKEFDLLCDKIGINSSTIKGTTHGERINNLINYCKEEDLTEKLVERIRMDRLGAL